MDVADAFDADIRVPAINTLPQVRHVVQEVNLFKTRQDLERAMTLLENAGFAREGSFFIGVKKLLSLTEMCAQDPDGATDKLVTSLVELAAM